MYSHSSPIPLSLYKRKPVLLLLLLLFFHCVLASSFWSRAEQRFYVFRRSALLSSNIRVVSEHPHAFHLACTFNILACQSITCQRGHAHWSTTLTHTHAHIHKVQRTDTHTLKGNFELSAMAIRMAATMADCRIE